MKLVKGKVYGRDGVRPLGWKESFEVVFVEGKGFKWVTQVERSGVKFEPRESVYSPFMVQYIDVNGSNRSFSNPIGCYSDLRDLISFFVNYRYEFTEAESKHIWGHVITLVRNLAMNRGDSGSVDELLRKQMVGKMIDMYYSGEPINSIQHLNITFDK